MSVKLLQATPDFTILIHTTPSIANERQLSRNRPGEIIPSFLNEKLLLDHYSALQKYEFTNTVKKKFFITLIHKTCYRFLLSMETLPKIRW